MTTARRRAGVSPKRIADTSREALLSIASTLSARRAEVLTALKQYRAHHLVDPTAYELLRSMQHEHPSLDVNGVRPRLTELKDAGAVRTSGKRECAVTEKRDYTWAVVAPVVRSYEHAQAVPAVQGSLL
jgi:hypothetical protein